MTNSTKTKTRKIKHSPLPVRRRDAVSEIEQTQDGDLAAKGYAELDEAAHTRELTDKEIEAIILFDIDAAYDLLNSDHVRSVDTNSACDTSPTVYRLEDVHSAWRSATVNQLPNVATVRDVRNSTSDEDCCLGCLCDRFLEQTLEYIVIDHRAGLIVLQGV